MLAQFRHFLFQKHQRCAYSFDLFVGQITLLNTSDCLTLHELPKKLHQRQDQAHQPFFDSGGVGVDPLTWRRYVKAAPVVLRLGHRSPPTSPSAGSSEPTDEINVRREITTMSTSAIDSTISPLMTTPPASTRSSKSTNARRRSLSAGRTSVMTLQALRRTSMAATVL